LEIKDAADNGFESGFTGFLGLDKTTLDSLEKLLLNSTFISWLFADASRIGGNTVYYLPKLQITITLKPKTSSVILKIL